MAYVGSCWIGFSRSSVVRLRIVKWNDMVLIIEETIIAEITTQYLDPILTVDFVCDLRVTGLGIS